MTRRLLVALLLGAVLAMGAACCERESCPGCGDGGDGGRDVLAQIGDVGDIGFVDAFPPLDLGGTCAEHRKLHAQNAYRSGGPAIGPSASDSRVGSAGRATRRG